MYTPLWVNFGLASLFSFKVLLGLLLLLLLLGMKKTEYNTTRNFKVISSYLIT